MRLETVRRELAEGETTARDLLEEHLAVLEEREPVIRAMVCTTVESARRQADEADRRLAAGDDSPLLGIPFVVKDLIDVAGVPTTAGSRVLSGNVPNRTATAWRRLADAGAILVGKANTHEFAYGGTTEPTRNPADPARMVGGSSGGSAAALAAGYCLGALGSDTAGSIRIPANLCGVAGLKPSGGAVPADGVIPLAPTLDVVGPMARQVADLDPIHRVLTGVRARGSAPERSLDGVRIGLLEVDGPTDPDARAVLADAARVAQRAGARIRAVELPGFAESVGANFAIIGFEATAFHRQWADRRDLYTPYVRDRLAEAEGVSAERYSQALAFGADLARSVDRVLEEVDVVLLLGVAFPATPAYDERILVGGQWCDRDTELCRNTAFANLTGHPALAVPAGLSGRLPVGVQLVGRRGADLELISLGAALQDEILARR